MRRGILQFSGLRGHLSAPELLQWSAGAFIVSLMLFFASDGFDIGTSALFFDNGRFVGRQPAVEVVRDLLKLVYVAGLLCATVGLWYGFARRQDFLTLSSLRWLVVLTTLVVGPGLVANVLLKDQMGRARPSQTELFGGSKTFTPPLMMAQQCEKNCSFVSGEASSMFALFFGLAMVAGSRARPLLALGLFMGCLSGLIRISQGAHFLSDVVFAGIFMALTAALMRILIIDLQRVWASIGLLKIRSDAR